MPQSDRWKPPAAVHPIPNQPTRYTTARDELVRACTDWRKDHERSTNLAHKLTPNRSDRAAKREQRRIRLLFDADELALTLSRVCGESYAIRMADAVRSCLALTKAEESSFLGLWTNAVEWVSCPLESLAWPPGSMG